MVTIQRDEGSPACVIAIEGDVDVAVVPEVRETIDALIADGCVAVIIDLSRVVYADSSALGLLVWIDRRLQPYGGKLVLAGADGNVSRVLELSGLIGVAPSLSASRSVDEALAHIEVEVEPRPPLWTRRVEGAAAVEGMAALRTQVADLVRPLGLSEPAVFDLKVAVGEALANAIRHGSPGGHMDMVVIDIVAYEDRVEVMVSDSGAGFDGDASCTPDVYASGGRGLMFMRALMDKVEFLRCANGGTTVRLVKRLPMMNAAAERR
jgi:anti-anti-sigma factor